MANAATLIDSYKLGAKTVKVYNVAIDTTGQDLTIQTPAAGHRVFLVGLTLSDGTANNITWKSGSTTLAIPELGTNQGVFVPVTKDPQVILNTKPGEALVINCSAALTSARLAVIEAKRL